MRVLRVLTRANLGGPARQCLNLCAQDQASGLQTLWAFGSCGRGETELPLEGLPICEVDAVDQDARGGLRLRHLGRDLMPWSGGRATRELRRVIRRFAPEVVHTHTSQAGWYGRRAAWAEGVPVTAHTFHGLILRDYYGAWSSRLLQARERRLAGRTDLLCAVSPSCAAELRQLRIAGHQLEVVPPAVQLFAPSAEARRQARERLALTEGCFALGFVGRLVAIKRPRLFVELLRELPDVQGRVLGAGPALDGESLPGNLRCLGAQADAPDLLPGFDALVLCSRREGLPLVALEAFAAGVPVIGLEVPGVADALGPWGAGILVPERAGVRGLVEAVDRLRQRPALRAELREKARAGLGRFAPAAVGQQLAAGYRRLVEARAKR